MRTRPAVPVVLALVLVALMMTLTILAYADPPDPTWIPGYWDGDDFDDVIGYIMLVAGLPESLLACELRPVVLSASLKPSALQASASTPRPAASPRAPPTF
jgi:hypothetical protein